MKKVVLKIKDSIAAKIRKRGMHLGMNKIEMRPKVFEYEETEFKKGGFLKSIQFNHYMEIIKVKNIEDLEVGAYTDGKKVRMSVVDEKKTELQVKRLAETEAQVKESLEFIEFKHEELKEREGNISARETELDELEGNRAARETELDELAESLEEMSNDLEKREKFLEGK